MAGDGDTEPEASEEEEDDELLELFLCDPGLEWDELELLELDELLCRRRSGLPLAGEGEVLRLPNLLRGDRDRDRDLNRLGLSNGLLGLLLGRGEGDRERLRLYGGETVRERRRRGGERR